MNGCEKASALVTAGGVATRSGDLRCTRIVERCFVGELLKALGENAAYVGGFGSSDIALPELSSRRVGVAGAMSAIQGVSEVLSAFQVCVQQPVQDKPKAAMQEDEAHLAQTLQLPPAMPLKRRDCP